MNYHGNSICSRHVIHTVGTVRDNLAHSPTIREVIFCCFSRDHLQLYEELLLNFPTPRR